MIKGLHYISVSQPKVIFTPQVVFGNIKKFFIVIAGPGGRLLVDRDQDNGKHPLMYRTSLTTPKKESSGTKSL